MPQLKILFRRLGRDRLMTLFTVCGLVAGISAFLLLFIHVMNERQFDRHIREYENIYRVLSTPAGIDQAPWARSLGLVHSAAANIPGIELATQFTHCDGGRIRMGERSMVQDNIMSVDEAFIQMFGVESRLGNLRDLEKPNTVFISEDFAKKYFGDQDPVGQLIHIEALQYVRDLGAYEIRGIVRNTDSRTHFRYALLISQKGGLQERFEQLANRKVQWTYNYYRLSEGMDPAVVTERLKAFYDESSLKSTHIRLKPGNLHDAMETIRNTWEAHYPGQELSYFFMDEQIAGQYASEILLRKVLLAFSLAGIIICLLGMSAMALFIARQRTREIGIRKVNGAGITWILVLLSKDFIKWILLAFVPAIPLIYYAISRWLENFAFRTALSWWIFVLAGIIILVITLFTVCLRSYRSAARNPVEALRYE